MAQSSFEFTTHDNGVIVHADFESVTGTWQYVVVDPDTKQGVVIDSVLDFNPATATLGTHSAEKLLQFIQDKEYIITHILETHAHADHLTASRYIQASLVKAGHQRPDVCIGKRIVKVQETFAAKYGLQESELTDAFDRLLDDDEVFKIGNLSAKVLYLPGHTPDHVGYLIGANIFAGDSLFNPDVGSARCDFPGGSAVDLFATSRNLLSLPDHYRLYTGHDYPPTDREPKPYYTIAEHRNGNKHVGNDAKREDFIDWRQTRDSSLGEPRLLHQAMQVNIRGGRLPRANSSGMVMFNVPIKGLDQIEAKF